MPSSPVPPPLISASRITTLLASLIVAVSAGTKYVSRDHNTLRLNDHEPSGVLG
jgi:hypothetical protein